MNSAVNIEYCRGIIAQARATALAFGLDWAHIEELVTCGLEKQTLQLLIENKLIEIAS